jgi:hypothetical protein
VARAFGLPGQFTGAKAHNFFMNGYAAACNGQPRVDLTTRRRPDGRPSYSAAVVAAYNKGYDKGLSEKKPNPYIRPAYDVEYWLWRARGSGQVRQWVFTAKNSKAVRYFEQTGLLATYSTGDEIRFTTEAKAREFLSNLRRDGLTVDMSEMQENPIRPVEGAHYRYQPIGWDRFDPKPIRGAPIAAGAIVTVTGGVGGRWKSLGKATLKFVWIRDAQGNEQSVSPNSLQPIRGVGPGGLFDPLKHREIPNPAGSQTHPAVTGTFGLFDRLTGTVSATGHDVDTAYAWADDFNYREGSDRYVAVDTDLPLADALAEIDEVTPAKAQADIDAAVAYAAGAKLGWGEDAEESGDEDAG